ncbi:MAG: Calx-beta domain-containing protein [Lysobacterales bacterium]
MPFLRSGATQALVVLCAALGASPLAAQVVINEIDYDQPGSDTAEYLELKNVGAVSVNLDNYTVELVNGNAGGAAVYDTIDLPNVNLAAGDYYVICANAATVANCDLDDAPNTDFIQSGAPDAVGLRLSGVLVDAVSYEGNSGAPYVESSGTGLIDSGSVAFQAIARFPDGSDSNVNNVDLSPRCASPGLPNPTASTSCADPAGFPNVSIADVQTDEGNGGPATLSITVSLDAAAPAGGVSIPYATADDTATAADNDYVAASGTLVIAAGAMSGTIDVTINGDLTIEGDEDFLINLGFATNANVVDNQAVVTLFNDDVPVVSIAEASILEGNPPGTTTLTFTATISTVIAQDCVFRIETIDGGAFTATGGVDYVEDFNIPVTIPGGSPTATFDVTILRDTDIEADETFQVSAYGEPFECDIFSAAATGTILNDDAVVPNITIADVSAAEGNAGPNVVAVTVSLDAPAPAGGVFVDYSTANLSATVADNDYISTAGTLSIGPGAMGGVINVTINGDLVFEADESFALNLGAATGAVVADNQGVVTILNDDGVPAVSIDDISQNEGNSGSSNFTFTMTLSNPSSQTMDYLVYTVGITATAGSDYTEINAPGTLVSFPPLSTSQTVPVSVNGDFDVEPDEIFEVYVTEAGMRGGGVLATGTGTILNDDVAIDISIDDVSVVEGTGAGSTNAVFTVTLSSEPLAGLPVTVDYGTASGAAISGTDFTATSGQLSFVNGGALSQTISVPVTRDDIDENDEGFVVNLSNAVNAALADGQGAGQILDDDAAPTPSVDNIAVVEGNAGTANAVFTVSLSNPSAFALDFLAYTVDGTASAPTDYSAIAQGAPVSVSFAPLATSATVTVLVNGDLTVEADESFTLNLIAGNNRGQPVILASGIGTISNDDSATLTLTGGAIAEGNSGTSTLTFTATLSNPVQDPVSVQFATADGSATAPADYLAASGTLTFAGGQTSQTIAVTVIGDNLVEPDENLQVILSNPQGGSIATGSATGTIVNDDSASLSIDDVTQYEGLASRGAGAPTPFVFTVSSSNPSASAMTVNFQTADGTATAPPDYVASNGTLTIVPGATSATLVINVIPDTMVEPDETFSVNLSAAVGASIADAQGMGTILGDDQPTPVPVNDPRALLLLMALMLSLAGLNLMRRR